MLAHGAAGYLVVATVLATVGTALVHADGSWLAGLDRSSTAWLADHRTGPLDAVTGVFSIWANTWSIVIGATGAALVLTALRRWGAASVLVVALVLEITVFLSVNWIVGRPRPSVVHLDSVPSTSSFPSGHVAASVVLYGGWALLVRSVGSVEWVRKLALALGVLVPIAVAMSRVYRGLHHPIDVVAGGAMGAACLAIAVAVTSPLADRHQHDTAPDGRADRG